MEEIDYWGWTTEEINMAGELGHAGIAMGVGELPNDERTGSYSDDARKVVQYIIAAEKELPTPEEIAIEDAYEGYEDEK
jgi:hypothetical protein